MNVLIMVLCTKCSSFKYTLVILGEMVIGVILLSLWSLLISIKQSISECEKCCKNILLSEKLFFMKILTCCFHLIFFCFFLIDGLVG